MSSRNIFYSLFYILILFATLLLAVRISLLFINLSQKNFSDPGLPKIRHSSLVCCRGLALLHFFFGNGAEVHPRENRPFDRAGKWANLNHTRTKKKKIISRDKKSTSSLEQAMQNRHIENKWKLPCLCFISSRK